MITSNISQNSWDHDWLAGLIDGDGCFLLSPKGYGSLEITVGSYDLSMIQNIANHYGGSIKPRAGTRSIRYRLHHKRGLLKLMHDVNGHLRNTVRRSQFQKLCDFYNVHYYEPRHEAWNCAYVSGLFDSDGKIVLSVKKHSAQQNLVGPKGKYDRLKYASRCQLTLGITQKYRANLCFLIQTQNNAGECVNNPSSFTPASAGCFTPVRTGFGSLSYDKSQNGYYTWTVTSRKNVLKLCRYFKRYPCFSVRSHRVSLIHDYYAHNDNKKLMRDGQKLMRDGVKNQLWDDFVNQWFKFSDA
jgi:hypothetical protein